MNGYQQDRPQGVQELGLTDSLWEMTLRCLHQDPAQRPNMKDVVGLLREMVVSSLSMEADLRNFFKVCKTQGRDGQREKAQEFADELDEVRHTKMHIANSSHTNPGTRQHRSSPGKTEAISEILAKAV